MEEENCEASLERLENRWRKIDLVTVVCDRDSFGCGGGMTWWNALVDKVE